MDHVSPLSYDDDNSELKEFYERYLQVLMTYPVNSLGPHVLRVVAVKLHSTLYFDSDWQGYASKMGITDNLHLATIQESSKLAKELPLYVTMKAALQHINGNLATVTKVLIDMKRFDVLSYLKPFIQELLKKVSATEVKGVITVNEQDNSDLSSGTTEEMSSETVCSLYSVNTEKSENVCRIDLDPLLFAEGTACESNTLQKNSNYKNCSVELKSDLSSNMNGLSYEKGSLQKINVLPSAPTEERLSVLIQHTECETEVAKQLSVKFREENFHVTTLSDMDYLIMMDSAGALSTVYQEVDFIVPIVSQAFLQQIHPQIYDRYLESADAKNNRTLYQLIMTEYRNKRCVNARVRPVLLPEMNRRLLINDVILSYSFRLWNEVPKLIRVLRETKNLIPLYRSN